MSLELKVPPLLLTVLVGALMWLIAWLTPGLSTVLPARLWLAGMLLAVGVAVTVAGVVAFARARTTVDPMHPAQASSIVTGGVYRITRNPMYLGMLLWLAGWAVYLGNLPACLGLVAFVSYMNRFQVQPEERFLEEKFGAAFAAYRGRVRRWL